MAKGNTGFKNLPVKVWSYLARFLGAFCLLYFGTKAVIGLTVPGGYYNAFVAHYLDYPALLRNSLLNGTKLMVALFGFDTYLKDAYHVTVINGRGVRLVYACLGYGLLSFWIAFIFANRANFIRKLKWIIAGCLVIWLINVTRISIILMAVNSNWSIHPSLDQHLMFNIIVYACIFFMIWLFNQSENKHRYKQV